MTMSTEQSLSKYVTLISNDGFEFIVRREAAYVAGTIKKMLDPISQTFPPSLRPSSPIVGDAILILVVPHR